MMTTSIFIDFEATGLDPEKDSIIELGALKKTGSQIEEIQLFLKPDQKVPLFITHLTGITNEKLTEEGNTQIDGLTKLIDFCKKPDHEPKQHNHELYLIVHNRNFDEPLLRNSLNRCGLELQFTTIDTAHLAYTLFPSLFSYSLGDLADFFSLIKTGQHQALADARQTYLLFTELKKYFLSLSIEEQNLLRPLLGKEVFQSGLFPTPEVLSFERSSLQAISILNEVLDSTSFEQSSPDILYGQQSDVKSAEIESEIERLSYKDAGFQSEGIKKYLAEHSPALIVGPPVKTGDGGQLPTLPGCRIILAENMADLREKEFHTAFCLTYFWAKQTQMQKPFPRKEWALAQLLPVNSAERLALDMDFSIPENRDKCQSCVHKKTCLLGQIMNDGLPAQSCVVPYHRYQQVADKIPGFKHLVLTDINNWQSNLFHYSANTVNSISYENSYWNELLPEFQMFSKAVVKAFRAQLIFKEEFHRIDFFYTAANEFFKMVPFFKQGVKILHLKMKGLWLPRMDHNNLKTLISSFLADDPETIFLQFYKSEGQVKWSLSVIPSTINCETGSHLHLEKSEKTTIFGKGFIFEKAIDYLNRLLLHGYNTDLSIKIHQAEKFTLPKITIPTKYYSEKDKIAFINKTLLNKPELSILIFPSITLLKRWNSLFAQQDESSLFPTLWEFIDGNLGNFSVTTDNRSDKVLYATTKKSLKRLSHITFKNIFMFKLDFPYNRDPSILYEKQLLFRGQKIDPTFTETRAMTNFFSMISLVTAPGVEQNLYFLDSRLRQKKYFIDHLSTLGLTLNDIPGD